ncbi:MAG TPA: NAD(P)-binding protein [Kofleriaceae bacterium]
MTEPIHVAVVGGGCAAMATAFELSRPEHRGRYRITVYQQGFRLGGKGASGRGPAGRIEEHGLHVWMGWYENAFRLLRECYAELAADPGSWPALHWRDAFVPDAYVGVAGPGRRGWASLISRMPHLPGAPGDPLATGPFTIASYVRCAVELLISGLRDIHVYTLVPPGTAGAPGRAEASRPTADAPPGSLGQQIDALISYGRLVTLAGIVEAGEILRRFFARPAEHPPGPLLALLDRLTATARGWIDALTADPEVRYRWYMVDIVLASLRGVIRDRVVLDPRGFDAINDHDFRDWLRRHGASDLAVDSEQLRGGLYDLSFAYADGDPARPAFAAGDALRGACRMFFTYRGAFFWKMRGGMGDVVFAPLYEVLRRRGVRFEFFHRLDNVRLAADGSHVAALEMSVQAEVKGGDYRPLVDVAGMPCWPAEPDYDQLVDGDALRASGWQPESFWEPRRAAARTLHVGDDFDLVVLGIGLGAIPHVCREIVARDPRWRAMTERVTTVATQAFQLWLRADLAELGWPGPSPSISGFTKPFDTWADMPHLIDVEAWRHPPRSIAYFCGALSLPPGTPGDPGSLAAQRERVRQGAIAFLDHQIRPLWPRAVHPGGGFRWELLADAARDDGTAPTHAGPERFATQFWTANVNPSDRYVQSMPGSSAYRISPLDNTYDNLTIAGDWTACGINVGCVEAAVVSGRLAAHAIAELPALADIIGYDHP